MTDRPHITCLMGASLDGRLHLSRWTESPDGTTQDWIADYEQIHDSVGAEGWIVGRTTMAEMAKGVPHPPADVGQPPRPCHFARRVGPFAIALDRAGKLHFSSAEVSDDHALVLLGPSVSDSHLAELVSDGVSYIIARSEEMPLGDLLRTLKDELGIQKLMLEGGGHVNGSFFAAGLVDELYVVLAPALDGSSSPAIVEAGAEGLKDKVTLSLLACDRLDSGAVRLRYAVNPV